MPNDKTASLFTPDKRRRARWLCGLVLVGGLLLTLLATAAALAYTYRESQSSVDLVAQRARATLLRRFTEYETLVRSGQAVFAGSSEITRSDWNRFTEHLGLGTSYEGVHNLVYIARVPRANLAEFLQRIQSRFDGRFVVDPPGDRPVYCLETYKGPEPPEIGELGTDYCYSARPRSLLNAAERQSDITISGQLNFNYKDRHYKGLVVIGPVSAPSAPSAGNEARHATGWVSATVPVNDLVRGLVPAREHVLWRLADDTRDHDVLYGSTDWEARAGAWPFVLKRSELMNVGGRQWTLEFSAPFHIGLLPWLILIGGAVISGLLFFVIMGWSRLRQDALKLADDMTRALRENERLLASITDNIFEGIYRGTPEEGLVYVNQALARMFGYTSAQAFLNAPSQQLYADPARRDELREMLESAGFYKNQEVEYVRCDGTRFAGVNNAVAVYDDDGRMAYFDGVISDITERKRAEARVHYLAHYDALTGLPNRSLFRDRLDQALGKARRENTQLAVMFVDLDNFKDFNDSLGHDAGDELLREVGRRLQGCIRPQDTVSRQAGDEFVVLIPDLPGADAATAIAHKFLQVFREPVSAAERELSVTGSIGIALYPDNATSAEELIRNADAAMYSAKEQGRNNFQFFASDMTAGALEKLALEASMRRAIERDEFELHYQPQVQVNGGEIIGFEALIRWQHPEQGLLLPGAFIPVAEQSSLIVALGEWVLDAACRQLRSWLDEGHPVVPVAINLSAVQFGRGDIVAQVAGTLDRYGLPPELLEVELTESAIMRDPHVTSHTLRQLKEVGVKIAVDDFGVGYSSLSYLKRFHVDRLKVDRSFISDLDSNQDDRAITAAIVEMAHALNLEVVAEGVETEAQLNVLRTLGCEMAQGYWFGRPVPVERMPMYLTE